MATAAEQRLIDLLREENEAFRELFEPLAHELPALLAEFDERQAELKKRRRDPEVLIRTGPGPTVEIFHSAADPCGRVNPQSVDDGKYERVLLREASEDRGLRPCSACAVHLQPPKRRRVVRRSGRG